MVAVGLFGVLGVGFFGMGALVISNAPAVTQEMAGILFVLCGVVSLGFGAVLSVLNEMLKGQKEN